MVATRVIAETPITSLSTTLDELENEDAQGAVSKDIAMTRSFIASAEKASGAEKKRFTQRAELSVELVRALVIAARISDAADAQEVSAYAAPTTLKALMADVEALIKKRDALKQNIKKMEAK